MYSNYFGFTTQPFTSLDNQVFLDSSAYQAACSCLRQGLAERRGLLLFTGAAGTGKTTLLRQLMTEVKDRAHCILFWNAHLGFDDLLNYLCDSLGLPVQDTGQMQKIQALEAYLVGQMAEGRSVVLMMDDAQNLPDETLEGLHQLARLETVGRRLLQIVLSGQPPLEARLTQTSALESLNRSLGGHCRLAPLDDATAIAYIHEHLRAAGHSHGADLFEPAALDRIVSHAQGIPRSINLICNQALLLTYLNSESRVCARMVRKVGTDHSMPASANRTASPKPESEGPVTVSIPMTPIIQHFQSVSQVPVEESITSTGEFVIPTRSTGLRPPSRSTRRHRPGFLLTLMAAVGALLITPQVNIPFNIPSDWNILLSSLDRFSWSGDPPEASLDRLSVVQIEEPADTLEDPDPLPTDGFVSGATDQSPEANPPTEVEPAAEELPDTATQIPVTDKETFPFQTIPVQTIPEELTIAQPESAHRQPAFIEESSDKEIEPSLPDAERIEVLLSQAKQQLAALQYTMPADANALDTYREVLELDPANAAALQGIEYIKSRFVQWAAAARARGERAKAQRQLEKALTIDPHDDDVRQRLEELRRQ